MTVSLAVERWRCEWPDDRVHWYDNRPRAFWTFGCKSLARRQVVVAVAQVADVIEEVRVRLPGEPWFPWRRAAPGGRQDYEHLDVERRWVVVLGRVDPCEEER